MRHWEGSGLHGYSWPGTGNRRERPCGSGRRGSGTLEMHLQRNSLSYIAPEEHFDTRRRGAYVENILSGGPI